MPTNSACLHRSTGTSPWWVSSIIQKGSVSQGSPTWTCCPSPWDPLDTLRKAPGHGTRMGDRNGQGRSKTRCKGKTQSKNKAEWPCTASEGQSSYQTQPLHLPNKTRITTLPFFKSLLPQQFGWWNRVASLLHLARDWELVRRTETS